MKSECSSMVETDGKTVWVHAPDGSTVGRFSLSFGMDVHTSVTDQLKGASQCLHCTHTKPTAEDFDLFRELMLKHYGTEVDRGLLQFETNVTRPRP